MQHILFFQHYQQTTTLLRPVSQTTYSTLSTASVGNREGIIQLYCNAFLTCLANSETNFLESRFTQISAINFHSSRFLPKNNPCKICDVVVWEEGCTRFYYPKGKFFFTAPYRSHRQYIQQTVCVKQQTVTTTHSTTPKPGNVEKTTVPPCSLPLCPRDGDGREC